MTYNSAATIAKATKAAEAVRALTNTSVTLKDDGYCLTICIGYTDDELGDAAYRAAQAIMGSDMGWGGRVEMAADISGGGITVVGRI